MSQEPVKIIIEVSGGLVQAVYGGSFIQAVVVDHDISEVREMYVSRVVDFDRPKTTAYDGGFPVNF